VKPQKEVTNDIIPIEDLVPSARNARKHPEKQIEALVKSIAEFGFVNPVSIWKNNELIGGHGRIIAAKKLLDTGNKKYAYLANIPVRRCDHLTDTQRRALAIADNKIALDAEWDDDILREELADLAQQDDIDFGSTGFDINDLGLGEAAGSFGDEEAIPEPPKEAITKHGDVIQLGRHRLICGDSTSIKTLETLMGGELVDLWLTDPPYNVSYEGKTKEKLVIKNDTMNDSTFKEFLVSAFTVATTFLREGGAFYIWHADSEGYNFRAAVHEAGLKIRQCLVWVKNTMVLGRQDYQWKHEPCLYGWKEGAAHFWGSDRKQTTVLTFDKPQRNGEHPTMKPVSLFEYQIRNSCKEGGAVLDTFAGSGTTIIAAEKSGRVAYLCELDPIYCDVIIKRYEEFTGKKARRLKQKA